MEPRRSTRLQLQTTVAGVEVRDEGVSQTPDLTPVVDDAATIFAGTAAALSTSTVASPHVGPIVSSEVAASGAAAATMHTGAIAVTSPASGAAAATMHTGAIAVASPASGAAAATMHTGAITVASPASGAAAATMHTGAITVASPASGAAAATMHTGAIAVTSPASGAAAATMYTGAVTAASYASGAAPAMFSGAIAAPTPATSYASGVAPAMFAAASYPSGTTAATLYANGATPAMFTGATAVPYGSSTVAATMNAGTAAVSHASSAAAVVPYASSPAAVWYVGPAAAPSTCTPVGTHTAVAPPYHATTSGAVSPPYTVAPSASANSFVATTMAVPVAQPQLSYVGVGPLQPVNVMPSTLHTSTPAPFYAGNNTFFPNGVSAPRKLQDLPEFGGQPEDWPIFFNAFSQSTATYGYTNLENNQRLQKCLKGEAKDIVKSLLIHPDNVSVVIEQLRFRFGRPEQLVRSQLTIVKDITPITDNSLLKMIPFATKVQNLTAFLHAANAQQHLANPTLLEELIMKLPMSKRVEWARFASTVHPYPTLVHFNDWLTQAANLLCTVQGYENPNAKRRVVLHAAENQQGHAAEKQQGHTVKCHICEGPHKAVDCQRLINASVSERWSEIKRRRLCFSCLNVGHSTRDCRRRKPCSVDGCKKMHHQLLHDADRPPMHANTTSSAAQPVQQRQAVLSCTNNSSGGRLLFRILPVRVYGQGKCVETYALLDEGSSVSLIDDSLVKELGLRGQKRSLNVQWFDGQTAQEPAVVVNVLVSGVAIKKKHQLKNIYSVPNLNLPAQSLCESDLANIAHHKAKLPVEPYNGAVPKLLIGLDHCHLGLPSEILKQSSGPYAANTELGWTVFGPTNSSASLEPSPCLFMKPTSDATLHNMVAEYFETESFGVKPSPPLVSADDARANSILQSTTRRVNGRFETGLLWRSDTVEMPESYEMARKRLIGIEKKMRRDEVFAAAYKGIINSYLEKQYARKLSSEEAAVFKSNTWYLPHFAVVNPHKPGKIRLVFDAAAEVQGVSLNSQLLKGPQEYRPLPAVLFHFREGAIAVCGDIKEMFHQILIRPEDRSAQRFLWRDGDGTKEPEVYEMRVMTFGAACSPCAAQYVKSLNASEYGNHAARAVKAVLDYHYVDDFVDSFDSAEEAIHVSQQVRAIHSHAGFELRGFTSNAPEVLSALDGTSASIPITHKEGLATEKVLGMVWQPAVDSFMYQLKFHTVDEKVATGERRPTKRELLSIIMSIFDPLGFLSHITIAAKLLMREVWRRKLGWDELLPDDIDAAWTRWRQLMPMVTNLEIPRFYFRGGAPKQLQLHVFVDASEDAFAAAAYWRATNASGEKEVAFICSKARCAPLKPLTIPRLELQAAVLGTRLVQTIKAEHSVKASSCFLWTDSKTVVRWVACEHRRYKPFVAHRVAEILATTTPSNWRWLPTTENVADEATRANCRPECHSSSRWLTGPTFLKDDEKCWPLETVDDFQLEDEELRPKFALTVTSRSFVEFDRFSSFMRLVRTIAWVQRFVGRCRRRPQTGHEYGLTSSELDAAKCVLCRQAQVEAFPHELKLINKGVNVPRSSSLYQLTPYIDEQGVLRVQGRIDAAGFLPIATRRPVILPPNHDLTKLVVAHYHCEAKHQNTEATICEIRRHFWIPRLRQLLRSVVAKCFVCRLSKATPVAPVMGPLPSDRVTPFVRPFSYTGLDYFGPIVVTVGRRQEKRWVALFTCLTVRAIHLEIAYDLSTDACIIAIRNFINRRGIPVRIRSDNGKNFVGANHEAKKFAEVFDCERVQAELSSKGVEWRFNCPLNPSEGGAWERMVQCVKRVLRQTLKEIAPREHTLHCFLVEAENVVNSRPLTHLPVTADQEEPLTPNHFLLGAANTAQTPSVDTEPEKLCALRKQWRIARQLRDRFWKRWIAEYLPTLTRRVKWCQLTTPLKKGDLVFVCDASVPRRQWCRGIVDRVYLGVDGVVRQADVRTAGGVMRRAASKLAVLQLENGESG